MHQCGKATDKDMSCIGQSEYGERTCRNSSQEWLTKIQQFHFSLNVLFHLYAMDGVSGVAEMVQPWDGDEERKVMKNERGEW